MKKVILLLAVLFTATCIFAQVDSTVVVNSVDQSIFDLIYNFVTSHISAKALTIILTVGWILEYVITYVKWTPANSVLAFIWNGFKKIVAFIANKKTV